MNILDVQEYAYKSEDAREGRYYGKLSGVVTDINDPKKLGRIKARVQGMGDNDQSDWLVPMWPGSMEALPFKDDPVVVDFIDGNPNMGCWSWHPHTSTKNRPTEAMVLGTTLAALVNQMQADLQTLTTAYLAHKHTGVTPGMGSSAVTDTPVFVAGGGTVSVGQCQDPTGAPVAPKSGNQTVLSKNLKVR